LHDPETFALIPALMFVSLKWQHNKGEVAEMT